MPVHKVADFPRNKKTLLREMALLKVISSSSQLKKAQKICLHFEVFPLASVEAPRNCWITVLPTINIENNKPEETTPTKYM